MRSSLANLSRYRDLLFWLAVKEIRVRYKSPLLGLLWSLLVPLAISAMLFVVFTYLLPVPKVGAPFFLFLIVAMFPWNFFASSVSSATTCVLEAGPLIKKSPFPRALIPLSIVAANVVNFLFALAAVLAIIVIMRLPLTGWVWSLPLIIGLEVLLTVGVALLVAGLQVRYRDVKYLTEIGLLVWFYLTPIFYSLHALHGAPPLIRSLYLLNPLVSLVELFRLALLGGTGEGLPAGPAGALAIAALASLAICGWGMAIFRRLEPGMSDQVLG